MFRRTPKDRMICQIEAEGRVPEDHYLMWMGLKRAQMQAELSAIAFNCKGAALALRA